VLVDLAADQEKIVVASFDPLGVLATADTYALEELLSELGRVGEQPALRRVGRLHELKPPSR